MNSELKRELMIEHFNNPVNKGLKNDPSYIKEDKNNSSCIDHFTIELKLNGDVVEDIRFDGEACAIATSSLSIAISKLIGKTKEEAISIIDNYNKMIKGEEFDKNLLEELIIYEDVSKQPARVKCATLGIDGILDLLKK
ncbi:MAG: SUF system NifU family Fe-S cluster assembly protein [Bacilli bacterium]|jgi:nitrogen fixation NifU-like protein|nr:SUF system NifU family Fe-S cluster assembly protein [Bacilli bacterium]